jgi:hypothetical protein
LLAIRLPGGAFRVTAEAITVYQQNTGLLPPADLHIPTISSLCPEVDATAILGVAEAIKTMFDREAAALTSADVEANAFLVQTPDGGYTISLEIERPAGDTETDLVVTVTEVEEGRIELEAMITGIAGALVADIGFIVAGEASLSVATDAICRAGLERLYATVKFADA